MQINYTDKTQIMHIQYSQYDEIQLQHAVM